MATYVKLDCKGHNMSQITDKIRWILGPLERYLNFAPKFALANDFFAQVLNVNFGLRTMRNQKGIEFNHG